MMPKYWDETEQIYLINAIDNYRSIIDGKVLKEAKRLTRDFALNLQRTTPELSHRSQNSINERLPYLDNLLAGALEEKNYATKDRPLYGSRLRVNSDKGFNQCNTRHHFNGHIR